MSSYQAVVLVVLVLTLLAVVFNRRVRAPIEKGELMSGYQALVLVVLVLILLAILGVIST